MSRDEIMQLEGVALAEAVAKVLGRAPWVQYNDEPRAYFRPDTDHNHAAEVRARMCELYGGRWEVVSAWEPIGPLTRVFYHSANQDGGWGLHGRNECVEICRVALLAKAALG